MSDRAKDRLFGVVLFSLFVGVVCWIFYASLNAESFPAWTGFGVRDAFDGVYPARTLWDWLSLLLVPVVLAVGGLLFTWFENRQSRELEAQRIVESRSIEERRIQEARELESRRITENLKIEEKRLKEARELEDNRAEDAIVKEYLDQMTDLLLNHALRGSAEDDEVRSVARARTLTALRGVDGVRKATIVQFLYEARLIRYMSDAAQVDTVVQLNGADLEATRFFEARLAGVDLSGADLTGSKFTRSDLGGARLAEADLRGANLSEAYLGGTNLRGANLSEAYLGGAYLDGVDLTGVDLEGAELVGVNLFEANLTGVDLTGVDLEGAELVDADLSGTKFTGAKLNGAILTGADLSYCHGLTCEQLFETLSLHGATLPDDINPADLGDLWSPPKPKNTPEPEP